MTHVLVDLLRWVRELADCAGGAPGRWVAWQSLFLVDGLPELAVIFDGDAFGGQVLGPVVGLAGLLWRRTCNGELLAFYRQAG